MAKKSNKIIPEYIEDQVPVMIASYLTFISFPFGGFHIELFSSKTETKTGADAGLFYNPFDRYKKLKREQNSIKMVPFYMQFKRPEGYPSYSKSQIIRDRNRLGLNCYPHALFFKLREKSASASDYQHNLLFNLNKRANAAYVVPLFLTLHEYRKFLMHEALMGMSQYGNPFCCYKNAFSSSHEILRRRYINHLFRRSILPGHIVFPPHTRVCKHNHKYSFSIVGDDLCFHSPQRIEENPLTMLEFLTKVRNEFLAQIDKDDGDRVLTAENAKERLSTLTESLEMNLKFESPRSDERDPENPFAGWLEWGAFLREKYKIHQYMMTKSD